MKFAKPIQIKQSQTQNSNEKGSSNDTSREDKAVSDISYKHLKSIQTGGSNEDGENNENLIPFELDEDIKILVNAEKYQMITSPPVKPKGGSTFLYSTTGNIKKSKDWKCDQYQ